MTQPVDYRGPEEPTPKQRNGWLWALLVIPVLLSIGGYLLLNHADRAAAQKFRDHDAAFNQQMEKLKYERSLAEREHDPSNPLSPTEAEALRQIRERDAKRLVETGGKE